MRKLTKNLCSAYKSQVSNLVRMPLKWSRKHRPFISISLKIFFMDCNILSISYTKWKNSIHFLVKCANYGKLQVTLVACWKAESGVRSAEFTLNDFEVFHRNDVFKQPELGSSTSVTFVAKLTLLAFKNTKSIDIHKQMLSSMFTIKKNPSSLN